MKITVVGCGKIGCTVINALLTEGHEIVAIDNDPDVISDITNIYDVMTVCGSGTDSDVLLEAGNANLLIAVTGSDEFNMLTCFIAKRLGIKHTIARIRKPEYNDKSLSFLKKELGLSMAINPERLVSREMFNILKLPSAIKVEEFSRGNFEMVELILKENSPLDGVSLIDLKKKHPDNFLVCAVQRGDKLYIPDGNFVLKSGDKIGITSSSVEIQRLLRKLGILQKQARDVMILGATRTSYYLSKLLLAAGNSVKIIDADRERCKEFSDSLPGAVIINGDPARQELLLEEGIGNVDAVVALTGMDEENILLSYFAAMQNVPKVIAKVNRNEFLPTAERLGIDSVASQIRTVGDVTVRYARALENSMGSKVETLYKLMNGNAEALEFAVNGESKIIKIPFKELPTKSNILIAGIIRGRKTIIPSGDDMIMPGDRVVVISGGGRLNDLSDIVDKQR
ncbi:MAG TPA: Trk system potassium transporter TrkA [Ruminococcaceae bacterium]|nr:Trk system potassium transporter TrkA [Oscillospiraceae bacterium]